MNPEEMITILSIADEKLPDNIKIYYRFMDDNMSFLIENTSVTGEESRITINCDSKFKKDNIATLIEKLIRYN